MTDEIDRRPYRLAAMNQGMAVAIACLLVSFCAAAYAAEWQTSAGDIHLKSISGAANPFVLTLGGNTIECRVTDWPTSEPVGKLGCSDGSTHTIELIDKQTIEIDGVALSSPE